MTEASVMTRRSGLVLGVTAMAMVATACGGGDSPAGSEGASGGSFSMYVCEPEHLIPQNTNETCGAEVLNALFTPLVEYDPENSAQTFEGAMGESITSDDQKVWTIKLK